MKRLVGLTFAFASILLPAAARASVGDDTSKAPAKAAPQLGIPKDAIANSDGTWSYTDKQGKHWTYVKTPFGVSRSEAAAEVKAPAGLPKGAVRNSNGSYSWTDKTGKKWLYAVTPFGLSRTEAPPETRADATQTVSASWKSIDKGDTVRFERGTPVGTTVVWEKKKTDLNDEERRVYEAQHPAAPK